MLCFTCMYCMHRSACHFRETDASKSSIHSDDRSGCRAHARHLKYRLLCNAVENAGAGQERTCSQTPNVCQHCAEGGGVGEKLDIQTVAIAISDIRFAICSCLIIA